MTIDDLIAFMTRLFRKSKAPETPLSVQDEIKTILEKCQSADRIFGVSGTIPKPDSLDRLTLMAYTGPVISKVTADQLIKQDYISAVQVKVLEMNYAPDGVRESFKFLTKSLKSLNIF